MTQPDAADRVQAAKMLSAATRARMREEPEFAVRVYEVVDLLRAVPGTPQDDAVGVAILMAAGMCMFLGDLANELGDVPLSEALRAAGADQ
jgi:hypothetical protein